MDRASFLSCPPADLIALRPDRLRANWHVSAERTAHPVTRPDPLRLGPLLVASWHGTGLPGPAGLGLANEPPFYGVLLQLKEPSAARASRSDSPLEAGSILIWHGREPCEVQVSDPLHKLQLRVNAAHFELLWPHLVPHHRYRWLPGHSALAALARCSADMLWQRRTEFDASELQAGLEAVLDLIGQSARQPRHAHRSKADLYQQVLHYIDRELENPALDPGLIARRHGCSVRALHALFAECNATVAGSIRQRRLERCRTALQDGHEERISQVALRWGFSDAAHFSKLFKSTYGLSPRSYRDEAQAAKRHVAA